MGQLCRTTFFMARSCVGGLVGEKCPFRGAKNLLGEMLESPVQHRLNPHLTQKEVSWVMGGTTRLFSSILEDGIFLFTKTIQFEVPPWLWKPPYHHIEWFNGLVGKSRVLHQEAMVFPIFPPWKIAGWPWGRERVPRVSFVFLDGKDYRSWSTFGRTFHRFRLR